MPTHLEDFWTPATPWPLSDRRAGWDLRGWFGTRVGLLRPAILGIASDLARWHHGWVNAWMGVIQPSHPTLAEQSRRGAPRVFGGNRQHLEINMNRLPHATSYHMYNSSFIRSGKPLMGRAIRFPCHLSCLCVPHLLRTNRFQVTRH